MHNTKGIICLCYRKIIDASAHPQWDKYVFESTYQEFRLQAQFYNQEKKYTSFSELLLHAKGAEKLHFLVSAAVTGYLQQLCNKIPDIVNSLGRQCLSFKNYHFEIIQSDTRDKSLHRVAINFFSEPMVWYETIGSSLLLGAANASTGQDEVLTTLVPMQSFLDIYSIKTEQP
jgi:hypothetical protein